jgi:hypothetical protein
VAQAQPGPCIRRFTTAETGSSPAAARAPTSASLNPKQ